MKSQDVCTVSKRIKDRRKQLGMTQAALAEKLDVNTKTIVTIEQMSIPTFATDRFISLCSILDCSPDYLMGIDDLPHRETSDIHALIGLEENAIEKLMALKNNNMSFFRSDSKVSLDFINKIIVDMNFDTVVNHIRSLAWAQINQDESERFNKKLDESKRLKIALKNKTDEDKAFADKLYEIASDLLNDYSNMQNAADASYLRFTQSMGVLLDTFSKEKKSIVQEEIYEKYGGKERFISQIESEVFEDEKGL